MAKHAFLIMAHNNVDLLKKTLELLDDPRNDIYIHWDLRSSLFPKEELRSCVAHSTMRFVPRIKIIWGGYSQIACELLLMEAAFANGPYAYYHLLSGVDLVLKTPNEFHSFFNDHIDTQFVVIDRHPENNINRYRYYYFFPDSIIKKRSKLHMNALYALDRISLYIQKTLGVNRIKSDDRIIAKGDNWFSITEDCIRYVLSEKRWIQNRFIMSQNADELFLQMLLWNSPYRNVIYNGGFTANRLRGNLRLIDWQRGKPYVWRSGDYGELASSPCLFARKFDPAVDSDIIDRVYSHVKVRLAEQHT